mgnify:CR=1 FL=1
MLLDLYPAYNALWGTVAASVPVQASAAVALSLDATVTGAVPVTAAATCALSLGAVAAVSVPTLAAASGTLALSGTVAASVPTRAAASVGLSLSATVTGSLPVQATAAASLSLGAIVTARVPATAAGAGGLSMSGVVVCEVPVTCAATGRSRFSWLDRARTRATVARSLTLATVTASTTAATVARSLTLATPTASSTAATVTRSVTEARLVSTTYVKRLGDTLPVFEATLTRDGVALDLTAATVTLRYWLRGATTSVTKTMTVTSAANGVAEYAWAVDEPATEGVYDFVVETVLSTGDTLACPNGTGWGTFTVTPAPPGA